MLAHQESPKVQESVHSIIMMSLIPFTVCARMDVYNMYQHREYISPFISMENLLLRGKMRLWKTAQSKHTLSSLGVLLKNNSHT